jgi:hypothetical protein
LRPTIEVIVSPTGETRIQTKGFAGSSCRAATAALEHALGVRQAERLTAEFYAQQPTEQPLKEGCQQ